VSAPSRGALRLLLRQLPLVTALLAVLLDLSALANASPRMPAATVAVVFYWSLYRPDAFGPFETFCAGLASDALSGLPLGMTSLVLLLTRALLLARARWLIAQPFGVVWLSFAFAAALFFALQWLVAMLYWWRLFSLTGPALRWALTVLAYPALSWLLDRLRARTVIAHAAGI